MKETFICNKAIMYTTFMSYLYPRTERGERESTMRIKDDEQIARRREIILEAAGKIMETEGLEALSIRKIAAMIQQTPGIIYHYFSSKEELMLAVVQDGYQNILHILQKAVMSEQTPGAQLRCTLYSYLHGMLENPLLYQIIMQSKLPAVQEQTSILQENLRQNRKSIALLCECLEAGVQSKEFYVEHVELRAQSIWCCIYGLLERIILEQPAEEYRDRIIDEMVALILASVKPI